MSQGVLVVCPRGGAGEIFAEVMAREMENLNGEGRIGFAYPYLPDYKAGDPALLQMTAAVVRDAMVGGVMEFMFVDTGIMPVLAEIPGMMPEGSEPIIYDVPEEARAYFADPEERPLWLDRWEVMKGIEGFDSLYSLDRQDLRELIEEVVWRSRGVTGGNAENTPEMYQANLPDEEFLRTRAAQLLFKLSEMEAPNGILLGNADLAAALTRFIDEEFREFIYKCKFISLAEVLAKRLV